MKKTFVCIISILILLSMTLSSCVMSNDPDAIYKKIDKKMNKLRSYVADYAIDSVSYAGTTAIKTEGSGKIIVSGNVEDDFYYYDKATTDLSVGGKKQTVTTLEAYYNGKHYFSNTSLALGLSVYSESSAEDFAKYIEKISSSEDTSFAEGEKKNFEKNEDGGYTLEYSEYGTESIKKILNSYGFDQETFGTDVTDVNVKMETDKKLCLKTMRIEFSFNKDGLVSSRMEPKFVYEMTYSDLNEAEPVTNELKDGRFEKIEDVSILRMLPKMIEDQAKAESGKFKVSTRQAVSSTAVNTSQSEDLEVSYNDYGDSYTYDIATTIDKREYNISYADGVAVTKSGSKETGRQKQTEEEARKYIATLAGIDVYNFASVSSVSYENGVYTFKLEGYTDESINAAFGGNLKHSTYTVKATVNGDKLEKLEANVRFDGMIQVWTIITVDRTITFE